MKKIIAYIAVLAAFAAVSCNHVVEKDFEPMVADGTISEGMIPKLQNAFDAINDGVYKVVITSPSDLAGGTTILADPETDD